MPVYVIDTLKPKNGLNFSVVEAINVAVEGYSNLAEAVTHFATDVAISALTAALGGKADKTTTDNLQTQIDQIAQAAGTGTADTEVAQARVGADGTVFTTLKERIDATDSNLTTGLDSLSSDVSSKFSAFFKTNNLFFMQTIVDNAYYSNIKTSSESYRYFEFVPVKSGKTYTLGFSARYIAVFDSNKSYVSYQENKTSFTAAADGFINISYLKSTGKSSLKMYESTISPSDVLPYDKSDLSSDVVVTEISQSAIVKIEKTGTTLKQGYYEPTSGVLVQDSSFYSSEPIDISGCTEGSTIKMKSSLYMARGIVVFDSNMRPIMHINGSNASTYGYEESVLVVSVSFAAPANACYIANAIRTAYYTSLETDMKVDYEKQYFVPDTGSITTSMLADDCVTADKIVPSAIILNVSSVGKNRFDASKSVTNRYLNENGSLGESEAYSTSAFIDVSDFQKSICISPRIRKLLQYTEDKIPISQSFVDDVIANAVVSIFEGAKYVRFTYYKSDNKIQLEDGTQCTSYEPYHLVLDNNINAMNEFSIGVVQEMIGNAGDNLTDKKWCVVGDSFTYGGYSPMNVFPSGKYAGYRKVYPYYIGNRTGIDVVDFSEGGRTLAFPANPGGFTNSFTNPSDPHYYQNIPADCDYITIYLGINDSHHAGGGGDGEDPTGYIPIGTVNDNTTDTFGGAWNVVLSWLITNRPNAHIGIIVSNGCDSDDYRTLTIAIAQKYGIPYIDLNGDQFTPAMLRTTNPNIASTVKYKLLQKWSVDYPDNQHPTDAAHEFESYCIESFLRRI